MLTAQIRYDILLKQDCFLGLFFMHSKISLSMKLLLTYGYGGNK